MNARAMLDKTCQLNDIDALADALRESREYTLSMYGQLEAASGKCRPENRESADLGARAHRVLPGVLRPPVAADYPGARTPSRLPGADALFDSRTVAHDLRWSLDYPPREQVLRYLDETLAATLDDLASSRDDDRHRFRLALFHEDMHGEALLMTLHTLGLQAPRRAHDEAPAPADGEERDVQFPGGEFLQGARRDDGEHAFDNEKWAHPVLVEPFAMATRPVTNGRYLAFVEEDGYRRDEFWTPQGRQWRDAAGAAAPRNWKRDADGWTMRWFVSRDALRAHEPVVQVCRHEAEAVVPWAGRRLRRTASGIRRAKRGRGDRFPWGAAMPAGAPGLDYRLERRPSPRSRAVASGQEMMIGGLGMDSSAFAPFPGSRRRVQEYRSRGSHPRRASRGARDALRTCTTRRNYYLPHRNDIFAGFRTCAADARIDVR